jgi:hypothetical protein
MQPRFHCPGRETEPVGDVVDGQVRPEAEDDRYAQVDIQVVDGREEVALADQPVVGVDARLIDCLGVDRYEPDDPAASQPIAADVDEDPVEPRLEPCWISERPDPAPCPNERVMGRVLGVIEAAEDEAGEPIGAIELMVGESNEPGLGLGRRRSVQRIP